MKSSLVLAIVAAIFLSGCVPPEARRKMKAPRNKTIDLTVKEGASYLEKCIDLRKNAAKN